MTGFEFDRPKPAGANLHSTVDCKSCGGDRFVVVSLRAPVQSSWMREKGIKPRTDLPIDELAACPDCNAAADTSFRRHDGTIARALDPAKVRQFMQQPPVTNARPTPPAESRRRLDELTKLAEPKDAT